MLGKIWTQKGKAEEMHNVLLAEYKTAGLRLNEPTKYRAGIVNVLTQYFKHFSEKS